MGAITPDSTFGGTIQSTIRAGLVAAGGAIGYAAHEDQINVVAGYLTGAVLVLISLAWSAISHSAWFAKVKQASGGRIPAFLLAAMLLGLAVGQTGCVGSTARTHAELPALVLASKGDDGFESDVREGLLSLDDENRGVYTAKADLFFTALYSGDRLQVQTDALPLWDDMAMLANKGIDRQLSNKKIGPNGAGILRERIRQIGAKLAQVSERAMLDPDPYRPQFTGLTDEQIHIVTVIRMAA